MFNKSIAIILLTASAAHAQGEVDMSGGSTPAAGSAPVTVPGVNSSGAPFASGTLGLSFPVTLLSNLPRVVSLTSESVPTINVLYFLSETTAVDLVGGINLHRTQEVSNAIPPMSKDVTRFGFAVGAGYRMYKHRDRVATFLEPLAVLDWPHASDSATLDFSVTGQFGVEAMLAGWCSISGSIGAGVAFTNKAKDIQFASTTNLAANLYWK